jgi:cytoskeleton protein RodZ
VSETQDKADIGRMPAARLGAQLRATRQELGWELPDLAASLRIRREYLEAIEDGRMSDLPGTTYALGFVRSYASALGLSGNQVAARFRAETDDSSRKPPLSFPAPVPQRGVPAGALMLLGLVILAGAYAGWYWVSDHRRTPAETVPPIPDRLAPPTAEKPPPSPQVASILPTATPSAEIPSSVPATPPPPATPKPAEAMASAPTPPVMTPTALPPPPEAHVSPTAVVTPMPPPQPGAAPPGPALPPGTRIVLKATADAWVTIKQQGGPPLFSKLMHAGDEFAVPPGKTGLTLTTGNAGGTELDLDGAPIPGMGASGLVRRDLPLDPNTLKAGLPPLPTRTHPKPAPVPSVEQ